MRVKMKSTMAGPEGNASPGQVIDVSEVEAIALVAGGYAEWVDMPQETATARPQETAVAKPKRTARRK